MRGMALITVLLTASLVRADGPIFLITHSGDKPAAAAVVPAAPAPAAPAAPTVGMSGTTGQVVLPPTTSPVLPSTDGRMPTQGWSDSDPARSLLQSDRAFPNFIGPITNPILSKDPRSLTELRPLFIHNAFPAGNGALGGGEVDIYAAQIRLALTERLTLIADRDGIASLHPGNLPHQNGFLDLAVGLKYTVIRDVENQFLAAVGFQYEIPTGEDKVFQGRGPGNWTLFLSAGKEFEGEWHLLFNGGIQIANPRYNSNFLYSQVHVDKQLFGWLYPLAELNWYRFTRGGSPGLPAALGEGDGLINLGTAGVAGNNVVTAAFGAKAKISDNLETGFAWEFPLDRKDILLQRILVEMIIRY